MDVRAVYRLETELPFVPTPGMQLTVGDLELNLNTETRITWDNDRAIIYITRNRYQLSAEVLRDHHIQFINAGWKVLEPWGILEKEGY